MLDGTGGLTDIGSWYLGGAEVEDASATTPSAAESTSTAKKSGAAGLSRGAIEMVGSVVIGAAAAVAFLL
jgi:hypothetical protein